MPLGVMTLLDLMRERGDVGTNVIEEAVVSAPELTIIPADTIPGTAMRLEVRIGLPDVRFRNLNEGVPASKSAYEPRVFECAILDHRMEVDRRGLDGLDAAQIGRKLENHSVGVLEAALGHVGAQMYYGTGNDPKGFPGLLAQAAADNKHVIDATAAANKTSIWLFAVGREKLEFLFGNNQTVLLPGEDGWKEETALDKNGNKYPVLAGWMTGRVGFRLANRHAAVRIKNVGTDAGKTANGDLLAKAIGMMTDLKMVPTHFFMSGRSQEQLREARKTALNPDPPLPKDYEGIPIIRTGSITNAEE